jgi:PAS domain S-box-containing protein
MKTITTHITRATGVFTMLAGILVLAGWVFDIHSLKSVLPGIVSMKFNTAVCFVLSGLALSLLDDPGVTGRKKTIATVCSWIVFIAGLVHLSEYIFNINTGIDEILWRDDPGAAATIFPGRMSLTTSINFTLLGFIFITLHSRRFHLLLQAMVFVIIPGSLLTIFNYIAGTSFLNSITLLRSTALHTAVLFIVLCAGVFYSSPLLYTRFSFRMRIAFVFALVLIILGIVSFEFQNSKARAGDTASQVEHTYEVLLVTKEVSTHANEIQSAARGFILTGEEDYLPAFTNASDSIDAEIGRLKANTKDNPGQQWRVDSVKILLDKYISSRKELFDTWREKGFEEAQKKFLASDGITVFNRMRSFITVIEQEERQLPAKRNEENERNIHNSSMIATLFQVIIALLLIVALLVIYNNTRARDKAEAALRKNERFIKAIIDNTNNPISIRDISGIYMVVNKMVVKNLNHEENEIIGKSSYDFLPKEIADKARKEDDEIIQSRAMKNFEASLPLKDGIHYFTINRFPLFDDNNKVYAVGSISTDITAIKRAEEEIREINRNLEKSIEEKTKEVIQKEQQYRFLLQNMREGIQVIGYDWQYLFVNNSVVKQSKYSNEDLMGHTMMEMYPGIENTELFSVMTICMKERLPQLMENEFTFPDGSKEWYELSIQPVPEGIFILSMDITERKRAEVKLKLYAEDLKNSNTELERFAYVASHDLQEPLRMVSSFLHLLERKLEGRLDEDGKQYIDFAIDGSERMKNLIQDLLQYSRVGTSKESMTEVDCNIVMNTVRSVLALSIEETKGSLQVHPLPVVRAVQPQIQQLFQNLVSNALKYHGNEPPLVEIGAVAKGNMWEFYVKDNGIGIDPKFFDKIFIIFQRLHSKTAYSGTGIGLSICKKIVEKHGGRIWVQSEPGQGSTFYFTITKNKS